MLNLPSEVTGTVNGTTMTANYKYLPDGTKLSTADNSGEGFAYLGSLVYRKDGSSYTFGARFYDDEICRWTIIDPLAKKYFSMTPYNYCGNDPVNFVDPEGKDWRDINGNIINDHSKIMVYIFYDPNSFSSQSEKMYKNAVTKYGEGSVAMSNVTTEKEFSKDWGNMGSNIIKEVDLNYHGNNQTLMLDSSNYEYITNNLGHMYQDRILEKD